MDFRQNLQNVVNRTETTADTVAAGVTKPTKAGKGPKAPLWMTILSGVVLVGAVLLIILAFVSFGRNSGDSEAGHVNKDLYQAVFLNNGQVYFGKINSLNSRYINMNDVFYLTQNSATTTTTTSANTDYTLVKLGCQQIHYPKDQMIINRAQMTFWENLSNDGKVVKSIKEFQKQNPNGENCSTTSTGTQSSNSGTSATQNSTGTGTNTSTGTGSNN